MKLLHLSDLHLGKRVNEFSMIEDQEYILKEILGIIDDEKPDVVLIAGDVYDKTVPSAEAVRLFDDFLTRLSKRNLQTFIIYGNHDSPERLAFASRLLSPNGIHLSPVYDGTIEKITMEDSFGPVNIFLLPFIKPVHVRHYFPEEEITSYTDAVRTALSAASLDVRERNVLVTHQFVTNAVPSDSEELSVGGSDNVDASVFEAFDYTALGHLHRPQKASKETVRYCGSPLKYSFSEAPFEKSVCMVELGRKGDIAVKEIPLKPLHDMRELTGTYESFTDRRLYEGTDRDAYMHLILTDENDIPDAVEKLRIIYKNLMKLSYNNTRTKTASSIENMEESRNLPPDELFSAFYREQNGLELSEEQAAFVRTLAEEIWGGEA